MGDPQAGAGSPLGDPRGARRVRENCGTWLGVTPPWTLQTRHGYGRSTGGNCAFGDPARVAGQQLRGGRPPGEHRARVVVVHAAGEQPGGSTVDLGVHSACGGCDLPVVGNLGQQVGTLLG